MEKFLPCTPSVLPSEAGTRGAWRMRPPRPRPSWSSPLAGRAAPSGPARGSLRGTAAAGHRKEGPAARTTSRSARVTRGRALMSPAAPVAGELARQRPPHVYHHRAAAGCGGWRAAAAPVAATTVAAAVARTVCMLGNAPESTCAHGHGSRFLAAVQSQCKSTPAVPCSSPLAPRAPRGRHRRHRCRCLPSSSTTEPVRLAPPSPLRMPLFSFVFLVCLASTPPRLPRCPVHPSWLSSLANAAAAATTTTATSTPTVVPSPPPHRVFVGWGAGGELGLGRRSWGGEGRQSATPAACAVPLGRGARAALRVAALGAFNVGVLGVYLAVVERSKRRGGSYERDGYEFWGAWRRLPRHLREGEGEAGEQTGGTLPASTASLPTPPTPPLPPGGAATAAAARPPPGGRAA